MTTIDIRHITTFSAALVEPVGSLLRQLTSRHITFTATDLQALIEDGASTLFLLYCGEAIAGMLTLGCYTSPTGRKAWIEDVVVDEKWRGRGLGRRLVRYAVEHIRQKSPAVLMLTSNPLRREANALYQAEGFEQRCTNVYKMEL